MDETYWTVAQVARYFGVRAGTVRRWIAQGEVPVLRLPTRHLRITGSMLPCYMDRVAAYRRRVAERCAE